MGHPAVENRTPFAFALNFLSDEEARPALVLAVKATYSIGTDGVLALAEPQVPVNLRGEYWGPPENSSYKYEPETAFVKPAADVALVGHAWARRSGDTQMDVTLRLGPVGKTVKVIGDRYWSRSLGVTVISPAEPFEKIPLIYERAFGGWDRSHPRRHAFEPRNPVGTGFRRKDGQPEDDGLRLPNLEDPRCPIKDYRDTPPPAGFGFICPNWQPRASFAGTYDDAWLEERRPLLPKDFSRRFFNAASPGLVAQGFLSGDEPVVVENATATGKLAFSLPGVKPPECRVQIRNRWDVDLKMELDTAIVNTDDNLLILIWRAYVIVPGGPHDVAAIEISSGAPIPPRGL